MNTKLIILLLTLAFSTSVASAQKHKKAIKPVKKIEEPKEEPEEEEVKPGEKIYVSVETLPSFPGGVEELTKFIEKNLDLSKGKANTRVNLTFVVEKDGSLTDIKPIGRTEDIKTDEEAIRVIKLSPKWEPGKQNGRQVRVQYTVPVAFK